MRGHPMENEYAEVVTKCRVKENASLIEPPEERPLLECAKAEASEVSLRGGGCHGGGSESVQVENLLRPEPGVTGWFKANLKTGSAGCHPRSLHLF